jgi:hypothetical protein
MDTIIGVKKNKTEAYSVMANGRLRPNILLHTSLGNVWITLATARALASELMNEADTIELGRVAERVRFKL